MSQEYYTPEIDTVSFAQQGTALKAELILRHVVFVVGEGTFNQN